MKRFLFAFLLLSFVSDSYAINRIVIEKSKRSLTLYQNTEIIRKYWVALGKQPVGKKEKEGDNKTPEGFYYIVSKNPNSRFYKSLWVSYPNELDRQNAKNIGAKAGGNIMIHGLPNDGSVSIEKHQKTDWTNGCIAVTNSEMDEIWRLVEPDTAVEILP